MLDHAPHGASYVVWRIALLCAEGVTSRHAQSRQRIELDARWELRGGSVVRWGGGRSELGAYQVRPGARRGARGRARTTPRPR